ncbi:MAG: hypothetical protein ACI9LE_002145 [Paraglaciecola sp.]|jgi:hypothetical protein
MPHQDLIDNSTLIDWHDLPLGDAVCMLPHRADSLTVNLTNIANPAPTKPAASINMRQSASSSLKTMRTQKRRHNTKGTPKE